MTPTDNLADEAEIIKQLCLESIDTVIKGIADAESTIRILIDIALDLREQVSGLVISHIQFELPVEEGKAEIPDKSDTEPHTSQIHDYFVNIGPVNIYSMAGALSDTLGYFTAQTASVASIFTTYDFPDAPPEITPLFSQVMPSVGIEETEKEETKKHVSAVDRTILSEEESLFSELQESALVIKELEMIRDRMAETQIEQRNVRFRADMQETLTETQVLSEQETESVSSSELIKDIEEFTGYVHDFSGIAKNISTTIRTGMFEAGEVTELSSLLNMSIEAYTSTDISKNLTDLQTSISEIREEAEISLSEGISTKPIPAADLIKGEPGPEISSSHRMIELPAFMPLKKLPTAIEESAVNATALTDAIGWEYLAGKETISHSSEVMTTSSAEMTIVQPSLPTSLVSVSNAFRSISDYITISSELNSQMTEMMGYGEDEVSDIFLGSSPVDLLISGEGTGTALSLEQNTFGGNGKDEVSDIFLGSSPVDLLISEEGTSTALSLEKIVFGGDGGSAGVEPGIRPGIAATESLIREGASAVSDVFLSVPQGRTGYGPLPAAAMPGSMENIMQMFYESQKETTPSLPAGGSANHFQNTFNIVINMKGSGDEHELRELGRKIGTILSDEIKRYGGIG